MSEFIQRALDLEWGFIMSTLLIRFVGVFIVLAILMIGMQVLGFIVSRIISKQEAKNEEEQKPETPTLAPIETPEVGTGEEEVVAAIGAAIAVAMESESKPLAPPAQASITAGSWAVAGRIALMNRRLGAGSLRRR